MKVGGDCVSHNHLAGPSGLPMSVPGERLSFAQQSCPGMDTTIGGDFKTLQVTL